MDTVITVKHVPRVRVIVARALLLQRIVEMVLVMEESLVHPVLETVGLAHLQLRTVVTVYVITGKIVDHVRTIVLVHISVITALLQNIHVRLGLYVGQTVEILEHM